MSPHATPTGAPAPLTARLTWEHTHREMLPALIFLHTMAREGLKAELEHVKAIGPGADGREVLFLPFFYDERDRERYLFRGCEGKWVVNLCYEQMHFRCGRGYLLPDGPFARENVVFTVWGPRYRELLIEHGIDEGRIFTVGHPRFDIYHHRELLLPRERLARAYGLDPDKPWILVPYNFNMAYISDRLKESLIARNYLLTDEFIAGVAEARDAFTVMVRALCDAMPGAEVILRVHPAGYEAETIYKEDARQRANLHVIADYDIGNWIEAAALTIVWNSTSAMEAMVAGRPVISYEPEPFSERFDYDVNRILPTFRTVDEVIDVARALPGPDLTYDWALFERWYAHRDGRNVGRLIDVVKTAEADYSRFACQASDGEARLRLRRLKDWGSRRLGRPEEGHPAPPAEALKAAVDTLTVEPLLDFLK